MKRILFLLFVAAIILPATAQKSADIEKEEAAIKALLKAEVDAYKMKDFEKYKACYLQDDAFTLVSVNSNLYQMIKGWNEYGKKVKISFETGKDYYSNDSLEQKDFKININGSTALVSLIEVSYANYNGSTYRYEQVKTVNLLKKGGNWKITYLAIVQNPYQVEVPVLTEIHKIEHLNFNQNFYLLAGISFAKKQGKTAEDFGKYLGDLAKESWKGSFKNFANGLLYNFESFRSPSSPAIEIVKQTDDYFQFKVPWEVKRFFGDNKIINISFEELMTLYSATMGTIADYLGFKYKQNLLDNGNWFEVTITK